jgi:hypothetical protein
MMPMRIRRKGRPIEKLENPTALQCGGKSFPCGHATQFTLASTHEGVLRCIGERAQLPSLLNLRIVMAGLEPAMNVLLRHDETWTSPGMTTTFSFIANLKIAPRTGLAGYERFQRQSFGKLRKIAA